MICNVGELRDSLEIKKVEIVANSSGMSEKVIDSFAKLRCKLKKCNMERTTTSANKVINKQVSTFLIFTRKEIAYDMILEYKNENYEISNITDFKNGFLEITAEVVR